MSEDDVFWTARLSPDVKDYLQKKKHMSAGECINEYYKILKSKELPDMLKELQEARKHVLQLEENVTLLKSECDTKLHKRNTELDELLVWYEKQNRSIIDPSDADVQALKFQLKKRKLDFTEEQVYEQWRKKMNER